MSAAEAHLVEPWLPCVESHREWAELSARAPQLAALCEAERPKEVLSALRRIESIYCV